MVFLFVDETIFPGRTDRVPVELVRAFLLLVLHHVEEDLSVAAPGGGIDARDLLRSVASRAQVADVQVELAEAGLVRGVGELRSVVAHVPAAQPKERLPGGEDVHVEDHLFGRVEGRLAAEDRVLLSLLGTLVVPGRADPDGRRRIVLLDAREHLVIERLLQRLRRFHQHVGVGRFGAEIALHLQRPFLTQPEVVVVQLVAVDLRDVRHLARDRRLRRRVRRRRGFLRRGAAGEDEGEQNGAAGRHGRFLVGKGALL